MIKWKYKPHGNCPVQAEGYFLGYYFYFRARYSKATIEFSKTEEDWVKYDSINRYVLATTEDSFAAGWMPKWKCKLLIWKGCLIFMFKGFK
jgi:hypothetical protein